VTFPVELAVGSLRVPAHGVLETLGYLLGFQTYRAIRRRTGDVIDDTERWWVIAAAAVGALVGSRLLVWMENPPATFGQAGRTIVGGLLGGLVAVEWTKRRLGITRRTGDLLVLPLCLGIAIGRLGCFLGGLDDRTAGLPTSVPWAVDFGDGVPRHPSQLYEVLFLLALGAVFLVTAREQRPEGDRFKLFMVAYLGFRLLGDALKPEPRIFLGLSSIQWACVAGLVHYRADIRRWLGGAGRLGPAAGPGGSPEARP
jgi:prolipoprotein diacylglyceryltransferase